MKYNEKIKLQLKEQGLKKDWLCEKLGLQYIKFWHKMKENSFNKQEKNKIAILLGEQTEERALLIRSSSIKKQLQRLAKLV